jgi:hypothetical protein
MENLDFKAMSHSKTYNKNLSIFRSITELTFSMKVIQEIKLVVSSTTTMEILILEKLKMDLRNFRVK